jgi:hypothetical protein
MTDTFLTPEPSSDGTEIDEAASRYVEVLDRLEIGARILRAFAYVAGALWTVIVVCATWVSWDQYKSANSYPSTGTYAGQLADSHRVPQTLLAVAGSTWPYLAVAVIAYGASLLVDGRRLSGLLAAVTDDDTT